MHPHDIIEKLRTVDRATWAMGGAGIVLLFVVLRAAKAWRLVLVVVALALIGGAVYWHLHQQGRL